MFLKNKLGLNDKVWKIKDEAGLNKLMDSIFSKAKDQLKPELFELACDDVGQPVTIRMQEGYDHSYYFIQSFMDDHLQHHADALLK